MTHIDLCKPADMIRYPARARARRQMQRATQGCHLSFPDTKHIRYQRCYWVMGSVCLGTRVSIVSPFSTHPSIHGLRTTRHRAGRTGPLADQKSRVQTETAKIEAQRCFVEKMFPTLKVERDHCSNRCHLGRRCTSLGLSLIVPFGQP